MRNKGGEAEQSFGVNGIILLIFLVLVIAGIWYVVDRAKGAADNIPGQGEIIIQACNQLNAVQFQTSYCTQIRQIRTNEYTTCDYASNYGLILEDVTNKNKVCETMDLQSKIILFRTQCEDRKLDSSKDKINGKTCGDWIGDFGGTCISFGGEWKPVCDNTKETDKTTEITTGRIDNQFCCVAKTCKAKDSTKTTDKTTCEVLSIDKCGANSLCKLE
ncbi:MAG: hypothetical protein WC584_03090 [Candidatus Pacearchaeota archaeon]